MFGLFSGIWAKLAGAAAAVLAIMGGLFMVRRSGRKDAENAAEAKKAEAVQTRREIERETDAMDDAALDRELKRWLRKPPSR